MKKLLLAIAFVSLVFITKAQSDASRFHVGIGPTVALPIGDFANAYSFGIGGEVQGEYIFSEKFSSIFNTDFIYFKGKKGFNFLYRDYFYSIPILLGVRTYPIRQFFIGAKAGVNISTGLGNSYVDFAYRPEIGYNGRTIQVAFNFNSSINHGYSSNHLDLTAIYVFGSKKD